MLSYGPCYQPGLMLPDLLTRAAHSRHNLHIGYVDSEGGITIQTYMDLYREASDIASGMHRLGLKHGDKVIIATVSNKETIEVLWGCFLLGIVPTILQPPVTFTGYNPAVVKLLDVFEQLDRPYVFLSREVKEAGVIPSEKVLHRDQLQGDGDYPEPLLKSDDLAFIQFSSGSTGNPKGIMLTQENLIVNMDAISVGLDLHFSDHVGNWMPLYHDMGLIGYHLTPMYCVTYQYQIETVDFIMKPGLWLNLMSEQRITISGCTNFALALVLRYLRRSKANPDWNFSSMKALLNGAEPISVQIMQDFIDALTPFGFREDAMMPVYGMAEATLAISFTPLMRPSVITAFNSELLDRENKVQTVSPVDPSARLLSGVGKALNKVEIRITDPFDQELEEGTSGEIQVRGRSVTKGYFNKPKATAAAFCHGWLRTGDIGFFFEGNLYISGRQKDIIFKNGKNYFANDLETMACTIEEISYGKVCFGAVTDKKKGQDKVIVFLAGIPDSRAHEMFTRLRGLLRSNLGITVDELVLVKSNEIPKTSSGKLQRYRLMQRYIAGDFNKQIYLGD